MAKKYNPLRSGTISGRLVIHQNKFMLPSIRADTKICLPSEKSSLDWFRARRCTESSAHTSCFYRKVAALYFNKQKRKGPFIKGWGFALMLKRIRARKDTTTWKISSKL